MNNEKKDFNLPNPLERELILFIIRYSLFIIH